MVTGAAKVGWRMIDTPTRRAVLGAGVFAAGSLVRIDGGVAQAPLPATPACHDGDEATLRQTEGPFFKPSSPERAELIEKGMAGQPIELVGFVLSRACKPLAGALLDFWQADDKGRYIPVSACAAISSPTRKGAIDCAASCPAPMLAAPAIFM
jgi:Dioxygenase